MSKQAIFRISRAMNVVHPDRANQRYMYLLKRRSSKPDPPTLEISAQRHRRSPTSKTLSENVGSEMQGEELEQATQEHIKRVEVMRGVIAKSRVDRAHNVDGCRMPMGGLDDTDPVSSHRKMVNTSSRERERGWHYISPYSPTNASCTSLSTKSTSSLEQGACGS